VAWCREPGDVTDLSDQDGRDRAADPVDRLHRLIAAVVTEMLMDVPLEHPDLTVVDLDQVAQRLHPAR
jgi:hypothetical protein